MKHMGKDPEEEIDSTNDAAKPVADISNKDPGCDTQFFDHLKQNDDQGTEKLARDFGQLVVDSGKSRYVANRFWTALSEEVAEMRDILDDPSEEEDDYPSPSSGSISSASANGQGFLFNFSSTVHSLRNFHPPARQIPIYWEIFKENVDPVLRILHRPMTEKTVAEAARNLDHLSKTMESTMFAIYYAVVTATEPADCVTRLGFDKEAGLKKYRFAFEQSLARANLLSTQEVELLQVFTLFLSCARRSDDTRYVWTLTGLLIRLATALGLHRDGSHFDLSPYDTEMRRRTWWHICNLDVRSSEDHGINPSIVESGFDTKFPSNINDEDIDPSTTEMPKEHEGWTETTFDLIRYSVSTTVRRLSYAPAGPGPCRTKSAKLTLEDKEHIIEELHQYLERKYLIYCDLSVPLNWVAATVTRLIMAKMWLVVHHPLLRPDRGAGLPKDTLDRLFLTSLEVIEFSRLLETESATRKWGWLFATYQQWHAMAYLLSQLTIRTKGPEVERAWAVVDVVFQEWHAGDPTTKKGMLWKPLRKMMVRARAARAQELEQRNHFPLDGSIGPAAVSASAAMQQQSVDVMPGLSASANPLDYTNMLPFVQEPTQTIFQNGNSIMNGHHNSQNLHHVQPSSSFDPSSQYQPQVQQNGQVQNGNLVNQWLYDEATSYPQEQWPIGDPSMAWAGWDDMVKDFQVEGGDPQLLGAVGAMPMVGGVTNWW